MLLDQVLGVLATPAAACPQVLRQVLGLLVPAMADLATLDVLGEDGTPERLAVVHATDPALAALLHETACDLRDGTTATTLLVLRSGTLQLREACDPIRFELFHDGTNLTDARRARLHSLRPALVPSA